MGTLLPAEDHQPFYAQLCIHDQQAALATHNTQNPNLDHVLMGEFQAMFNAYNQFVPLYKQIMQGTPPNQQENLQMSSLAAGGGSSQIELAHS
jgi:hypothetical protein